MGSSLMDRIARLLTGATADERADTIRRYVQQRTDARMAALVADLEAHFDEDVAHERTMANLASLDSVPPDVLPNGDARTALVWLISGGAEARCYPSGGDGVTTGTWRVWLDPLDAITHGERGRVTIGEWCVRWRELLAEMGVALPAETETDAETVAQEGRVTA